jgi:hypothetical protein
MSTMHANGHVYALLADGSTVEIRPAGQADFDGVKAMHEAMSPDNSYLRFFNLSRLAAETEGRRICRETRPGRRHGMRLVGPNCFGIAVPGIGLDATFAASHPRPGVAGLVMQSGGLGFAMVDQLSRLGIGISSFASVGNKLDVSSNDMLMWWERDGVTRLAVLYIESFGNPRKFARTARRVSARMPVLAVEAGRSAVKEGGRGGGWGRRPRTPPRWPLRWSAGKPCSSRPASSPRPASAT